jgi:hypothetical protein
VKIELTPRYQRGSNPRPAAGLVGGTSVNRPGRASRRGSSINQPTPRAPEPGGIMIADSRSTAVDQSEVDAAAQIVFGSLADQGMQTMTEGGVEFVLCASALTAQM